MVSSWLRSTKTKTVILDAAPTAPAHPEAHWLFETNPEVPKANGGDCPHRGNLLATGRCKAGDTGVRAMSGRQLERFFRTNPGLAQDYAGDAFSERRAIAARYLSQGMLLSLLDDPDEVVRRVLAYRLPLDAIECRDRDEAAEVRAAVAARLARADGETSGPGAER